MKKIVIIVNCLASGLNFINAGIGLAEGNYFKCFTNVVLGILFAVMAEVVYKTREL